MKTLALSGGDLVISGHGYQTVTGPTKIRQDLSLALIEPYGEDPYQPGWGSLLSRYIGEPLSDELSLVVEQETRRVVQQYMDQQQVNITNIQSANIPMGYTTADVVVGIVSIDSQQNFDTLQVFVSLVTAAGATVEITRTVNI